MAQDDPKMAQDGPKMAHDGPKMAPRCHNMAPTARIEPKMHPTLPQESLNKATELQIPSWLNPHSSSLVHIQSDILLCLSTLVYLT